MIYFWFKKKATIIKLKRQKLRVRHICNTYLIKDTLRIHKVLLRVTEKRTDYLEKKKKTTGKVLNSNAFKRISKRTINIQKVGFKFISHQPKLN